jgi:hypothetical protein
VEDQVPGILRGLSGMVSSHAGRIRGGEEKEHVGVCYPLPPTLLLSTITIQLMKAGAHPKFLLPHINVGS